MTGLKHSLGILGEKKESLKKLMNSIVTQACGVSSDPLNIWNFSQDLP